jgi:hypothetical protein
VFSAKDADPPDDPRACGGVFVVGLAMSALFVEIDCAWGLRFVGGHPVCAHYAGDITVVVTAAAVILTVLAPAAAVRAWVRRRLAPRTRA